MNKFILNRTYTFKDIECRVQSVFGHTDYIQEHGTNIMGDNFIIVKDDRDDKVCSFVLVAATSKHYIYKCVYNDWEEK